MFRQRLIRFIKLLFSREVIAYVIAGVLTTLVNIIVFTLLCTIFGNDRWWLSNAPAIFAAILFAFYVNRIFVFRSKGPVLQELWKFFASRILIALAFEYGAMYLLYNLLNFTAVWHLWQWDILISKLLTQILVMVGNYVISKFLIFTSSKSKGG